MNWCYKVAINHPADAAEEQFDNIKDKIKVENDWVDTPITNGTANNIEKRRSIDLIAHGYKDSTLWAKSVKKDDFKPGQNKCNKFVYDVLKEAEANSEIKNRQPLAT